MKTILIVLILLLGCLVTSCKSETAQEYQIEKEEKHEIEILKDGLQDSIIDYLNVANFQAYTDSLNEYWRSNVYDHGNDLKWSMDTSAVDNYTLYDYRNGILQIEVYEFQSKEDASEYFNELKSQEYLKPFGLNKRPNHILVDSNRVFWHHMEHGFGHRMKVLNGIFASAFNFKPVSTNLDSVSGFNYCNCHNIDKDLDQLKGIWQTDTPIKIYDRPSRFNNNGEEIITCQFIEKPLEIEFKEDSIIIDCVPHKFSTFESYDLPKTAFYWKYVYPVDSTIRFSDPLTRDFINQTIPLRLLNSKLKHYRIWIGGSCQLSIIDIEGNGTYLKWRNGFYKMKLQ